MQPGQPPTAWEVLDRLKGSISAPVCPKCNRLDCCGADTPLRVSLRELISKWRKEAAVIRNQSLVAAEESGFVRSSEECAAELERAVGKK